jgi:hypothetical protein
MISKAFQGESHMYSISCSFSSSIIKDSKIFGPTTELPAHLLKLNILSYKLGDIFLKEVMFHDLV